MADFFPYASNIFQQFSNRKFLNIFDNFIKKEAFMDKNVFFRQATLAICSSLNGEISLYRCLKYISKHIPADMIYLTLFDPKTDTLHFVARADSSKGEKLNRSIKMPEKAKGIANAPHDIIIRNSPCREIIDRIKAKEIGRKDFSCLVLPLEIEGQNLGAADLVAAGNDRFTEKHAALFSILREPLSFAMSNVVRNERLSEQKEQLADDYRYLHQELRHTTGDKIIGSDKGLKDVMLLVSQAAPLNTTVLLQGETGVGKDVIANAIHIASPRKDGPFIRVNCGAIPETLVDSELFGHEKGAFTGAISEKRGRFERAYKGTIFLDEIGELLPNIQIRLLRVLQNREIERVGGKKTINVDIRVICATHQDLKEQVSRGRFREDLWYRINAFPIQLPPLRHRKEDIPDLAIYLTDRKSKEMGIYTPPELHPDAIDQLMAYDWPGNIRELENVIERTLINNRTGPLSFNHLLQPHETVPRAGHANQVKTFGALDDFLRKHISDVITMTKGRVEGPNGAAEILKINPSTLRKKMKKLGIMYGRKY
jgi:transcriptional regulator with GAF, ATPase, and Fis domain